MTKLVHWRSVVGWEDVYQVSSCGKVRSLDRRVRGHHSSWRIQKGRTLKQNPAADGYLGVSLSKDGQPFPEKSVGQQYSDVLARSRRDTLFNLTCSYHAGWTHEQFRHWVETGEEPQ